MSLQEHRLNHYDELLAASRGEIPLDLVIRGGRTLNVFTGELLPGEIGIHRGMIVRVYASGLEGKQTLNAEGKTAIPAFIDPHLHIESSMVLPPNYAAAVVPHGTGTVIADPHEIVNVAGVDGFRMMQDNSTNLPLRILYDAPTCVPSRRDAESSGADIQAEEINAMIELGAARLGELMSDDEILSGEPTLSEIIKTGWQREVVRDAHFPLLDQVGNALGSLSFFETAAMLFSVGSTKIGLHAPMRAFVRGMIRKMREDEFQDLDTYLMALGITADHECYGPETQIKLDHGMRVMLKPHIFFFPILPDLFLGWLNTIRYNDQIGMCTDDIWPDELVEGGGIAGFLRQIIHRGVDPVDAIRFATFNNAQRLATSGMKEFSLLGTIAPGYAADIAILDGPLADVRAEAVLHGGEVVAQEGELSTPLPEPSVPDHMLKSVVVPGIKKDTFAIEPPTGAKDIARVHILDMPKPPELPFPKRAVAEVPISDGILKWDGYTMIAVFNRYDQPNAPSLGLIRGYDLKEGALASTVAHDSHNLIVLGRSVDDMVRAANTVVDSDGGIAAVSQGKLLAHIPLPVGGLMSLTEVDEMAELASSFRDAIGELGLDKNQPILPFAVFSLPVGPGAKVTDLGMWDNEEKGMIPLFPENNLAQIDN